MKKIAIIIAAGLSLLLAVGPEALAGHSVNKKGLALVLSAGPGFFNGGDLNQMVRDWNKFFMATADDPRAGFDWSELKTGLEFGAEVIYYFSDQFALSLGFEYLKKENSGQVDSTTSYTEQGRVDSYPYKYNNQSILAFNPINTISTTPLTLNAYYFLPVAPRIQAFLKASLAYYLSRLKSAYTYNLEETEELELYDPDDGSLLDVYLTEEKYTDRYNDSLKGNGLGFRGGFGFEINFSPRLALMIEAIYRKASLKNWKGAASEYLTYVERYGSQSEGYTEHTENKSNSYNGQLMYISYSDGTSIVGVAGPDQTSARPAVIRFSGPALRFSFKVRF
jgi:hypothetical protein